MRRLPTQSLIGFTLFLVVTPLYADVISIETGGALSLLLNEDNHVPFEACSGETPGGTTLSPLGHLLPEFDFPTAKLALDIQYPSGTTDAGESFEYEYDFSDNELTGTLLVDYYKAIDDDIGYDCYHGAEIVVYYDLGAGEENLDLRFIQLYSETGDAISHRFRHHNIVDSLAPDDDPAYFSEGDEFYIPDGYE